MGKWLKIANIGVWFAAQMQTKNPWTSKTFWNSLAQKAVALAAVFLTIDPGTEASIVTAITAAGAVYVDWIVRKHTTVNVGDPLPHKSVANPADPMDDYDD